MSEKKGLIICCAIMGVFVLGGGAGAYYLWDVWTLKAEELKQLQGQVAEAKKKKDAIPGLKKDIAALKVEEKVLLEIIPKLDRSEYDKFANLVDSIRKRSGVSIWRAAWVHPPKPVAVPNRQPRPQPASVHKVQYDLAVTGSFFQLLRFINLLETERRYMNVESFTIVPSQVPAGLKVLTAPQRELKLTLYSFTSRQDAKPLEIEEKVRQYGKSTDIPD